MRTSLLIVCVMSTLLVGGCASTPKIHTASDAMQPEEIRDVMTKVADWQLANPSKHHTAHWTHGALFAGLTAWAQMADDDKYFDALRAFGDKNYWQPHKRPYHADDHAVGQMYLDMYRKYREPKMIAGIQERFDWILAHQPNTPLTHDNKEHKKRYNWCDALFMAPPVWAKLASITGEAKYLDYMNKEFWATTNYLYDQKEHLYFRDDRFFEKREANGEKVFWSRGNGWVFGGLARVLEELPEDHIDRSRYERIFKDMAAKIKKIQPDEGMWHSSLLDPVAFPSKEASGSGFYCYGLAWGINNGLLDEQKYSHAVKKAWVGLVGCVHPDGKLGNVQPIGADPKHVTAEQTEIYGVGSFLLAGSEVYKLVAGEDTEASEASKPNILFILVDDMGWSDLGCYGGEIETPNIDSLANRGIRFTQFYNTAKCMSSRACLLTGLYAQQCGMARRPVNILNAVTLGEVLRTAGYRTFASGKHHGTENLYERGFDHYYGLRDGCCNYWNPGEKRTNEAVPGSKGSIRAWCDDEVTYKPYTPKDKDFYTTDAFTDKALGWLDEKELDDQPFFLYLAYTAPHYPLHAWPEDIAKYKGKYDEGYEAIARARYERMVKMGLIDPAKTPLPAFDGAKWDELDADELAKEKLRMEIYAAMLDRADQNIGKILAKLKKQGKLENTLIMFASDNGASPERPKPKGRSTSIENFGKVASYESVGPSWATAQNTPLRKWKSYTHEGGIRTPFIVSWPRGIKNQGTFTSEPGHFIDIMPTLAALTGAEYPETFKGKPVVPMQGVSLLPAFEGKTLARTEPIFWQWSKGGGIREGNMKAVFWGQTWELHDMSKNHNETSDLAQKTPEQLNTMKDKWNDWYRAVSNKE